MKIACQSCGAKYSIADDKVQGKKVFKIKCKKCSADIIVRGDQAAPGDAPSADVSAGLNAVGADQFPEDEATRVVSGGENDAVWHAAIDDNNTGPFSVTQLKQYAATGQVNGETSVWKDGFADWKPLKDVPELAVQIMSAGGGMAAAPAASAGGDALFGGGASAPSTPAPAGGGGLFGGESKPAAKTAARTGAKASSGNDLFGGGKSSMFGDEAVETSAAASASAASAAASSASSSSSSAASPKLDAASMTGQRNENSVLFSLATLQQVAGSAPAKTDTKKDADASGLIDIKSMAGTMGPGGPGGNKSAVDEILSVGAGGGLASPLAAPVLAPVPAPTVAAAPEVKQKGSNTTVIASVLGASIILVGGGLGAVFLLKSGQQPTQVGAEGNGPNTANANGQGTANNPNNNANPNNNGQGVANNPNNGAGTAPNNGTAGAQPAGTGTPPAG
ncbi:MAG: zinc-ribbon domain-containing protein, partial [Myxococcales bacterium]|nr:zinc-ribbon domain-containing protein [Myxococcales bacterium]